MVDQEPAKVRWVGGEHHTSSNRYGVRGHDRIDAARNASFAGAQRKCTQVPGAASRGFVGRPCQ